MNVSFKCGCSKISKKDLISKYLKMQVIVGVKMVDKL